MRLSRASAKEYFIQRAKIALNFATTKFLIFFESRAPQEALQEAPQEAPRKRISDPSDQSENPKKPQRTSDQSDQSD